MSKSVRDDVEAVSPIAVSCTGRADKSGGDSSLSHHITTPGLTKVGDHANLASYLLFCVFPHAV